MTQATTAGIGTTTYTYGANGERVARTGVLGSTGFLVDPFAPTGTSEVAAEYDAAGVTTSSFTYGPELLSQHSGGATSYVHADAAGSVGLVTDATGAVSAATRFAAFGEQVAAAGHNPTPPRLPEHPPDRPTAPNPPRASQP